MEDIFTESDRHYISLLQENISRMASNSANCKTWLLTIVTAILALQLTCDELRNILWVALGLIILFYILDSYYLGLERKFIMIEKYFVKMVKEKKDIEIAQNIYSFRINTRKDNQSAMEEDKYPTTISAMCSPSTCPFYLMLFIVVLAVCLWSIFF